jgi:glycosyltransferase involved in cell wall biosynthesis
VIVTGRFPEDLEALARDLGGEVAHLEDTEDRRFAVIDRGAVTAPSSGPRRGPAPAGERREHLRSLGLRVFRDGPVVPVREGPKVAVVLPELSRRTETFFLEHLRRLPFPLTVLTGPGLQYDEEGRDVAGRSLLRRIGDRIRVAAGRATFEEVHEEALARHLSRSGVRCVLAEYGLLGLKLHRPCRLAGTPLVVHFHGFDAWRTDLLEKHGDAYREMFGYASSVVAVSGEMREHLIGLGAPPERVAHVHCGVDVSRFTPAAPEAAGPHFLFVGRFVEKKAPHLLLTAFAGVLEEVTDARLTLVGDGPLLDLSRQLAAALGIGEAVEFTGRLDPAGVRDRMSRARAYVQHSIGAGDGDREGTPVAVLEAMASALPVVSTRHAGIPEVVEEGVSGLLVAEEDVAGMAAAMVELARDPDRAAALGRAGRKFAEGHASIESAVGKLADLIQNALNRGIP